MAGAYRPSDWYKLPAYRPGLPTIADSVEQSGPYRPSKWYELPAYSTSSMNGVSREPGAAAPTEEISGEAFEQLVEQLYQRKGYSTEHIGGSGDQGIDIIATKDGFRFGIQTKRYSHPVDNSAVQQAFAGAAHHRLDRAVVVTNSTFTPNARTLAESLGVELVDGEMLARLL